MAERYNNYQRHRHQPYQQQERWVGNNRGENFNSYTNSNWNDTRSHGRPNMFWDNNRAHRYGGNSNYPDQQPSRTWGPSGNSSFSGHSAAGSSASWRAEQVRSRFGEPSGREPDGNYDFRNSAYDTRLPGAFNVSRGNDFSGTDSGNPALNEWPPKSTCLQGNLSLPSGKGHGIFASNPKTTDNFSFNPPSKKKKKKKKRIKALGGSGDLNEKPPNLAVSPGNQPGIFSSGPMTVAKAKEKMQALIEVAQNKEGLSKTKMTKLSQRLKNKVAMLSRNNFCKDGIPMSAEKVEKQLENLVALVLNPPPKPQKKRPAGATPFQVTMSGMPKSYDSNEFLNFLQNELKLKAERLDRAGRHMWNWVHVIFGSQEDVEEATAVLNGFSWKANVVFHVKNQVNTCHFGEKFTKAMKKIEPSMVKESPKELLKLQTTKDTMKQWQQPYWGVPYEDQLNKKTEQARYLLTGLCLINSREAPKAHCQDMPMLPHYFLKQSAEFEGLPCPFIGVLPAPQTEGYLLEKEFAIGVNGNNIRTVGFNKKDNLYGPSLVAPVTADLLTIPQKMKEAVWMFEKFLQDSPTEVYHGPQAAKGQWRYLTVRTGYSSNQMLLFIHVHTQNLTNEQIEAVKAEIVDFYVNKEGKTCPPTGIYVKYIIKNAPTELEHIFGDQCLQERICQLTIEIKAPGICEVNLSTAELMYKFVADLAAVDKSTAVLDLYCGTGLGGLILAQNAGQVIAADVKEDVVKMANDSITLNKISNYRCLVATTVTMVPDSLREVQFDNVVAIIRAPKDGLKPAIIAQLRKYKNVRRIVCISEYKHKEAEHTIKNFCLFCYPTSTSTPGIPFVPIRAVAIDTHPQCFDFTFIHAFERL